MDSPKEACVSQRVNLVVEPVFVWVLIIYAPLCSSNRDMVSSLWGLQLRVWNCLGGRNSCKREYTILHQGDLGRGGLNSHRDKAIDQR
jgi:hypothetical protein